MKKYEFNVNVYGKTTLEVIANSREEAQQMVNDFINGITIKDLELKESKIEDIEIKNSNISKDITEKKDKDLER